MSIKNIYFVLCETTNRVKIGTAFDVRARLASLQTGSPTQLMLIGSVAGDRDKERSLHGLFERYHSHGEWFEYDDPVRGYIEQLLAGASGQAIRPTALAFEKSTRNAIAVPLDNFIKDRLAPGEGIPARAMYKAYEDWCTETGSRKVTETLFGRLMKMKLVREDKGRIHIYLDVAFRDHNSKAA